MRKSPLGGKYSRTPQKISKDQVKRVVKEVRGSGNQPTRKGDMEVDVSWLCELKTVDGKTTTIHAKWLQKICEEALRQSREPAVILSFEGLKRPARRDWLMIPLDLAPWDVEGPE